MNPFRESADPGVDRTALRCAKIREDAETKRKLIEQREETKRAKVPADDVRITRWIVAGIVGTLCILIGSICAYNVIDRLAASQPAESNCRDEYPTDHGCLRNGQRLVEGVNGKVVCTCERASVPVPSSSSKP